MATDRRCPLVAVSSTVPAWFVCHIHLRADGWQYNHPILLPFCKPYSNLLVRKIDILHLELQTLPRPQSCSVDQVSHNPICSHKLAQDGFDLFRGQYHRKTPRVPQFFVVRSPSLTLELSSLAAPRYTRTYFRSLYKIKPGLEKSR